MRLNNALEDYLWMNDQITTVGVIADIFDGPHATPKKTITGPYFLSISSLNNGKLDLTQSAHLDDADFAKWTRRVTPQKGDLLFSYETRLGEAALMPDGIKACLGRRMGLLRPNTNKVLPEYLLYAFLSPNFQNSITANTITGATVNRISLNELPGFEIRIPDIIEQEAVSYLLSSIDKKIEINEKMNLELEQTTRLFYDYWFMQFDFPDLNGKPYKFSGGKMIFNDQLKRDVPVEWKVQSLSKNDITEIIKPKINHFEGTKTYLATADVDNLNITVGSDITHENRESRANMQPMGNSVWFAKMQNSIKHIIVGNYSKDLISGAIFSTGFMGLRVKDYALEYVASFIRNPYFEKVKDLNSHGATMSGIGNEDMKNIKFIVPDEKILKLYSEKTRPIYQQIDINRQESAQLTHLRNWLLPMLMTGQVKVQQ